MSTSTNDVSPAREFCERVVMEALGRDPEMTLAHLKGIPESCFRSAPNRDPQAFHDAYPNFATYLRGYRSMSAEDVGLSRLTYRALNKESRQVPEGLLLRAIEALRKGDEEAMHRLRWSSAGLAFAAGWGVAGR